MKKKRDDERDSDERWNVKKKKIKRTEKENREKKKRGKGENVWRFCFYNFFLLEMNFQR